MNKAERLAEKPMERRAGAKGNVDQHVFDLWAETCALQPCRQLLVRDTSRVCSKQRAPAMMAYV